jgi:hypothetical protein
MVVRDPCARLRTWTQATFLVACTTALVACGGSRSGSDATLSGVGSAGAGTDDAPSVTLDLPVTVGESNRIEVRWRAQGDLASFTVFVQRAEGIGFEAVDATVGSNSAQFSRGAAYRLDFPTARVLVRGCDSSNRCVDSNAQPLLDVLLDGVAQVAPALQPFRAFGFSVSLSADGNTLAAASNENDPNQPGDGTVRIFQRGDDGRWIQECLLERFSVQTNFGPALALSGDGQTLVVGASSHTGTVGGIGAPEASAPLPAPGQAAHFTGAIYVFTHDAQQRKWSRQAFIKAAVPVADEAMGSRVAVSHNGNLVLAGSTQRMYLFERLAGQWRQAWIFERRPGTEMNPTLGMAMSASGSTVAVRAGSLFDRTAIPYLAVHVFKPCPCGTGWHLVADLRSAKSMVQPIDPLDDGFGLALSFSGNGNTLAVGAPMDFGDASDDGTTQNTGSAGSGAVYIFATDDSGVWQRRAFLKARTAPTNDQFGDQVALSGDGKVLAATACGLAANADGLRRNHRADAKIGGDGAGLCGSSSYVFEQSVAGTWSHIAAAIPAPGEVVAPQLFSLAFSADGQTMGLGLTANSNGTVHSLVRIY